MAHASGSLCRNASSRRSSARRSPRVRRTHDALATSSAMTQLLRTGWTIDACRRRPAPDERPGRAGSEPAVRRQLFRTCAFDPPLHSRFQRFPAGRTRDLRLMLLPAAVPRAAAGAERRSRARTRLPALTASPWPGRPPPQLPPEGRCRPTHARTTRSPPGAPRTGASLTAECLEGGLADQATGLGTRAIARRDGAGSKATLVPLDHHETSGQPRKGSRRTSVRRWSPMTSASPSALPSLPGSPRLPSGR